jgi:hypothetical protein
VLFEVEIDHWFVEPTCCVCAKVTVVAPAEPTVTAARRATAAIVPGARDRTENIFVIY